MTLTQTPAAAGAVERLPRRLPPEPAAVLRPGGPPGAQRARGDLAVHAAQAAPRDPRRPRVRRAPDWETTLPEGVTLTEISAAEAIELGELAPGDRPAALAVAKSGGAMLLDVPADHAGDEPVWLRLTGSSVEDLVYGHLVMRVGTHADVTIVIEHTGSARYCATTSVLVGDGARVNVLTPAGLGRRRGPPGPRRDPGRPRRVRAAHRDLLRRRPGPHARQRRVRRPRRRGRAARPLLRRRGPAPRAPAVRRPQRAAHQEPRALQGCAAGPGRAHRVGRQRADPQGRRGHRDLRGEPQPGAHRRLPGRLGAQPRDRDRRDQGRGPRLRHRPLRRRAAVLPALRGVSEAEAHRLRRARLLQRPDPQGRRACPRRRS